MIAATSVLQQQASDIRSQKINWQSYNQSQMISNEDYQSISALDSDKKAQYLKDQPFQTAKTFLNLLSHVSKDTTIQYLLVMIDDLLTVSNFCAIIHSISVNINLNVMFLGGSITSWNLFGLCFKAQGECLGTFPIALESFWWLHYQYVIKNPR